VRPRRSYVAGAVRPVSTRTILPPWTTTVASGVERPRPSNTDAAWIVVVCALAPADTNASATAAQRFRMAVSIAGPLPGPRRHENTKTHEKGILLRVRFVPSCFRGHGTTGDEHHECRTRDL